MRNQLAITLLLGTALVFAACKKGNSTGENADSAATAGATTETPAADPMAEANASIKANVAGTWKVTKAEGGTYAGFSANAVGDVITFNADGSFTNTPAGGSPIAGTWDVATLQLKLAVNGQEVAYAPSMDSQQCILESNGVRIELTRQGGGSDGF
jgi:hypothetical protein